MCHLAAIVLCLVALPAFAEPAFEMPKDEDAAAFVGSNVVATFYHELGHAFIDVLELPVLGREEDAADTLSLLLVNSIWDESAATAIMNDTALAYLIYNDRSISDGAEAAYWDSHSLDLQRYYNLVCLFYGANPETRGEVVKELDLPTDRADGCPEEFELAESSWGVLLEGLEPTAKTKGLKLVGVASDDPIGGLLAEEIKDLNGSYGLPHEISVTIADCGEANAFYSADDLSITICSEYAVDLAEMYAANAAK